VPPLRRCVWPDEPHEVTRAHGAREAQEKRRDHACPYCAAAFAWADHLTTHVRAVHEKRRDHTCPHCAAAFTQLGNMTKRVRMMHKECRDREHPLALAENVHAV